MSDSKGVSKIAGHTVESENSDAAVLYCCKKCNGIVHTRTDYDDHIIRCDGSVSKSDCQQFVTDKTLLLNSPGLQSIGIDTITTPIKKKRGRPKKTPTKTTIYPSVPDAEENSGDGDDLLIQSPMKRPRRAAANRLIKKWEQIKSEPPDDLEHEQDSEHENSEKVVVKQVEIIPKVKGKRGRPRKNPVEKPEEEWGPEITFKTSDWKGSGQSKVVHVSLLVQNSGEGKNENIGTKVISVTEKRKEPDENVSFFEKSPSKRAVNVKLESGDEGCIQKSGSVANTDNNEIEKNASDENDKSSNDCQDNNEFADVTSPDLNRSSDRLVAEALMEIVSQKTSVATSVDQNDTVQVDINSEMHEKEQEKSQGLETSGEKINTSNTSGNNKEMDKDDDGGETDSKSDTMPRLRTVENVNVYSKTQEDDSDDSDGEEYYDEGSDVDSDFEASSSDSEVASDASPDKEEEQDYEIAEEIQQKKPRKLINFEKQVQKLKGKTDDLTLQYLMKNFRKSSRSRSISAVKNDSLKKKYEQYYQEPKERPLNSTTGRWMKYPGIYQCPKCPRKIKKVSLFHRHMQEIHIKNAKSYQFVPMSRTSHRNEETAEGYVEQSQSNNTANNETEGSGSTEQDEVPPDQYLSRQGTYEDPDKFDPQSVTSRQHYKRRREQWAVMYEKYVVCSDGAFSHYACPSCEYETGIMGHFHRHISRIHTTNGKVDGKVNTWSCPTCDFTCGSKPKLKAHMLCHVRPFLCTHCPKRFGNKNNLKDHVMMHEGVLPLQCPQCDYRARQKRCLIEHMRKHTGEYLQCSNCDFKTQYLAGLKLHELCKHQEKHLHPCPYCPYVTNDKNSLLKHVQLHQECKDFMCGQCTFTACTKYEVLKHMKTAHENFKMFFCDQCDYSSAYSTAFRNHLMLHYDLRPYTCSECEYSAPQKTRVEAHVKSKHLNGKTLLQNNQLLKFDLSFYKKNTDREVALSPRPRGAPRGPMMELEEMTGKEDLVYQLQQGQEGEGQFRTVAEAMALLSESDMCEEDGQQPLVVPKPLLQLPMDTAYNFLEQKPIITVHQDLANDLRIISVDYTNDMNEKQTQSTDGSQNPQRSSKTEAMMKPENNDMSQINKTIAYYQDHPALSAGGLSNNVIQDQNGIFIKGNFEQYSENMAFNVQNASTSNDKVMHHVSDVVQSIQQHDNISSNKTGKPGVSINNNVIGSISVQASPEFNSSSKLVNGEQNSLVHQLVSTSQSLLHVQEGLGGQLEAIQSPILQLVGDSPSLNSSTLLNVIQQQQPQQAVLPTPASSSSSHHSSTTSLSSSSLLVTDSNHSIDLSFNLSAASAMSILPSKSLESVPSQELVLEPVLSESVLTEESDVHGENSAVRSQTLYLESDVHPGNHQTDMHIQENQVKSPAIQNQQAEPSTPQPQQTITEEEQEETNEDNEEEAPAKYRYEIVDPEGNTHIVEVGYPLGEDENIVFVTEGDEEEEES